MQVDIDEIISLTLLLLDESEPLIEDEVEYGSPDFDLREAIRGLIPMAAAETIAEADDEEIREWEDFQSAVADRGSGGLTAELPADFRRLLFLRMSDWSEPVTVFLQPGDDGLGLKRLWERRGRHRHRQEPAVALLPAAGGRWRVEVFGSVAGARIAECGYLPKAEEREDGKLRFPASLLPRLARRLADALRK